MSERFKILGRKILLFAAEHHFLVLLLAMFVFIAYGAWIFWSEAYSPLQTPPVLPPASTISRPLFEEIRSDLIVRSISLETLLSSTYSNIFISR